MAKIKASEKFCYLGISELKIFKHILNIMIWTLVGLYLFFILTFSIPAVQEYAGKKAGAMLSRRLGTSVAIERVEYHIPASLTLWGVQLKDQRSIDMLAARRLSARVDLLPLLEGRISIASAQLLGVHARLYRETADAPLNCQFLVDSLASKDTTSTSPLNLRVNSLIVRHSSVSYDCLTDSMTPQVLNPSHLAFKNISAHVILKCLTPDSLNVNVKRLAFNEQSGLQVDRLSLRVEGGRKGLRMADFQLRMPGTHIQLGPLTAFYRFRGDHFVQPSLRYQGSISPSTVTLADLSCLLPALKTFHSTLSVATDFHGNSEMLTVPQLVVGSTTGDITLRMNGRIDHLRQQEPSWTAHINDLVLSAKTMTFISQNIKGERVSVPDELTRLGNIHLKGTVRGQGISHIETTNQLLSDAGNVEMQMALHQRQFKGRVNTQLFDLRRLLADDHFGTLSTLIDVSGQLPADGKPLLVKADGLVKQLEYNDYTYQNIQVKGQYSPTDIRGRLDIEDVHVGLLAEGSIVRQRGQYHVKVESRLHDLAPQAIHLSDRWGDARFSGHVSAHFTASDLNDAVGTLDITDLTMTSATDHYRLQELHLLTGYTDDVHYITLKSDFGEAEISGDFDYKTLPQSFTNFIAAKLPTLPGLPKVNPHTCNNFTLQARIHRSDWLEHLLLVPLRLTQPLTLHGMVNDQRQQIVIEGDIPEFYYDESRYERAHLSILSPLNVLQYDLSITKVGEEGDAVDIQMTGNAHNNLLSNTLQWDNVTPRHAQATDSQPANRMRGRITTRTTFDASYDGLAKAFISIAPSELTVHNTDWFIQPATITYTEKGIDIGDFNIHNDHQKLTVNGTISERAQDTLFVELQDIDVSYVLDLVDFDAVSFGGRATGKGNLRGVLGNLEADARLVVNGFEFEHGRMGTLHADVNWNADDEQIDIRATADDGPDAKTYILGYVSPKRNYIDLGLQADGTHLDFARSFMESFISYIDGHGQGELRLAGPLDAINLTGDLVLNGEATVSTLGCTYQLRDARLHFIPNEIEFAHVPVYDIYGREAMMTGGIHHQELTNLTFDIFVKADNLLAYDFKDFGEDTFYGTVFATGQVAIHGRENSLLIEAEVTPQRGTVFVYNAASPDAINNQEFIVWGNAPSHRSTPDAVPSAPAPVTRDDVTMRLKINATPDATVRLLMDERTADYITLRGNGELQTTFYNKGGFSMFGTYRVTEGTYGVTIQNIIKKNFVFKEGGTIVFSGDPYDAALQLQAQHTVNGVSLSDLNVGNSFSNTVRVNCLMNIGGQPRAPIIDFDIDLPNVNADEKQMVRSIINSEEEMNQQVVYLPAVGRFYPQCANNAATTEESPSRTTLAMQSLLSGTLSGQLNDVLNRVIKSNNWNFGANISTGDEGWNNAEYEGIINGRLLNNRLLINGQFGYRDNKTTATPSFIGDFDIRYLLYPNGNLALKVYNQTNDRYFTKSSLNTQGIGIIMKRDFDGLSDLFGRSKERGARDERQETRDK